jgi:hypothetical protein
MKHYMFLALAGLSACYTYATPSTPTPEPGRHVAVRLTPEGTKSLANQLGPTIVEVTGEVLRADSTGLQLAVQQVENNRQISTDWKGEQVTIPRADVADVRERRLSLAGTGLLGGMVAGGLVAAYALIGGQGSVTGRGTGGGVSGGQ